MPTTDDCEMSITDDEVRHIGKLAAIRLADSDVSRFQRELGDILSYVERLVSVNTKGVPPTSHVHGVTNFFRDDIIKDSFGLEEVRPLGPDMSGGGFRVPKII
jgi:aspartyl-tRNA(Asn)/glutamyl-tRNA(Gln) amidotransferase subunit C